MASYKKYAEDLIGNWETGQYEPQRTVTQNIYQTNWNKLSNDFNTLKDKLARNFSNAQMEYGNVLNDVQNQSFNRMRNADIDLASRGLSTSGVGNLIEQADIQQKGQDIDKALNNLLGVNNASIEGLTQGVTNLGQKQSSLAGNLAGELADITGKEAENAQQYAGLIAGLGQSAASRAASRSGSSKSKADSDLEEAYRRMGIAEILMDDTIDDESKALMLSMDYDVPNARDAIKTYNDNKLITDTRARIGTLENRLNTRGDFLNNLSNYATRLNNISAATGINPYSNLTGYLAQAPSTLDTLYNKMTTNNLNRARNKIDGLTYQDMYDYLYNR